MSGITMYLTTSKIFNIMVLGDIGHTLLTGLMMIVIILAKT